MHLMLLLWQRLTTTPSLNKLKLLRRVTSAYGDAGLEVRVLRFTLQGIFDKTIILFNYDICFQKGKGEVGFELHRRRPPKVCLQLQTFGERIGTQNDILHNGKSIEGHGEQMR
jgi:hypothetical protein